MFADIPLVMVEDDDALQSMIEQLSRAKVIAIDTESDSSYAYQEKVCLIQISDSTTDFILDPLLVDDISPLAPILADPKVVKVLHGADYDIVCLRRDFDFQIRGLFDTLIAAQLLGLERIGLADLIGRYFGHTIDKKFQRHNWALRPLKPEHLDYARGDTHFLLALREVMLRQVKRAHRLKHMREECRILEKREWGGRSFDENAYLDMKGSDGLTDTAKRVLRRLWLYREEQGKRMNRPVYKVIPNEVLLSVARQQPTSREELDRVFRTKGPMKRRHGAALVKGVQEGLEDDFVIPRRTKKRTTVTAPGMKRRLKGRAADRALAELKAWRNRLLAKNKRLTPFTIASNGVLKAISVVRPYDLEELAAIPEVRMWQVRDWGEDFLDILDKVDPR